MTAYVNLIGDGGKLSANAPGPFVHVRRIKLADECVAAGVAVATGLAATDTVAVIKVPAGTFVHRIMGLLDVPEGATLTIDVGDAADPDGFIDGMDLNGAAGSGNSGVTGPLVEAEPNTLTGYMLGKYYSADTNILVTINNNGANVAEFELKVLFTPNYKP